MSHSDQPSPEQQRPEEILFAAALGRPHGERAAFLDHACQGDAALRLRLDALLAAHDLPDALPEPPAEALRPSSVAQPVEVDKLLGQQVGRYKLLERIGEGGCGVVYVAEQTEPVRRRVALKLIKPGMDSKTVIARFEVERQALALMDHPNIAAVLDGGTTESGLPFFVMELVRGAKLTEHCDHYRLSTEERIRLFVPVCQAVQHAHQKGIIHRDIKPSNVVVTIHDGVAVPKVIDFGIAKAIGVERLTDQTIYTALDQFVGTPAYMSPEQAGRTEQAIDARTDVYSLGVLLYELLTGRTPFDARELLDAGFERMLRTIRQEEPPRPSQRLSTLNAAALTSVAQARQSEPPRLLNLVRGDLDWIAMKCLEKNRARRYDTANDLVTDLRRHLEHEPIVARPPSAAYRSGKFVRRHRAVFAVAGAVALGLVVGVVVSHWSARRIKLPDAHQPGRQEVDAPAASRLVVTSTDDSGPGSLREIILASANGAIITFASHLSGKTIYLTSGHLLLDKKLTIDGSSLASAIQINGNHDSRVFQVGMHVTAVMNSLTITNGFTTGDGGGIENLGTLTLNKCIVVGNSAQRGGGIYNFNRLFVNASTFTNNSADGAGGAINSHGSVTLDRSTVTGNRAGFGGGVRNEAGQLVVSNSLVANNTAVDGSGIYISDNRGNGSSLRVFNSTFTGNFATGGNGGGLRLFGGTVEGVHCTIVGNSVKGLGGGVANVGGKMEFSHSIIAGNSARLEAGLDLAQGDPALEANISGKLRGTNNFTEGEARLAPLGNYGGPTLTMPPLSGSPAIDAAVGSTFITDQRGFPRPVGAAPDLGAVEAK